MIDNKFYPTESNEWQDETQLWLNFLHDISN